MDTANQDPSGLEFGSVAFSDDSIQKAKMDIIHSRIHVWQDFTGSDHVIDVDPDLCDRNSRERSYYLIIRCVIHKYAVNPQAMRFGWTRKALKHPNLCFVAAVRLN
jgi:hypothetical protein